MTLEGLQRATQRLSNPENLIRLVVDAADKHKREITDLIKGQISVGVRGDGKRTLKYTDDGSRYNPSYYVAKVKKKAAKQMPYRNYENNGDFIGDMFTLAKDTQIFVGSYDSKSSFIEAEEDNELFQITDENVPEFWRIIGGTFIKLLTNEFN